MTSIDCLPQTFLTTKPSQVDPRPKPILLVLDDEEGPRQSLQIVFKDDFRVLLADSGAAAVALASEHPIDVAVLDIRMKGMSGIEVLHALKSFDPATEVVMLTGYETVDTARQALRLGASDYLNKPFDIATIRDAVRTALNQRNASLHLRNSVQRLRDFQDQIHDQQIREELARTRGEIYASIIHDINSPLTVISGFIDVVCQRLADVTRLDGEQLEFVKERLNRVSRQVTSCIQISNRYLSFLRESVDQVPSVSVNQILSDVREILSTHASGRTHTLSIHLLAEDCTARINGTDLIQILYNLAVNAFQSAEQPHCVKIRAEPCLQSLDVSQMKNGLQDLVVTGSKFANTPPMVAVTVEDNGPGMHPELVGRVFDSYFTTKPPGQGTGLGLPIVKRLVEHAGGAIKLHTEVGHGTVFTVYLPVHPPAEG
ncbi:MAG: sensor histidine kinase [Verrucomicrobiia bacterium]